MNSQENNKVEGVNQVTHALKYLRYTAATDIGMRREENQDSYGVIENSAFRFFIVADGMGGVQGGATASKMAVNIVEQYLKDKKEITSGDICQAISVANKLIFEKGAGDPNLSGMGTTFVGIAFAGNRMFIVNVGDSRAYCIRNNQVIRLTEDHTLVMELVRSGTISVEQASNHPVSHMLTRSLGPTPEIEIDCQLSLIGPLPQDQFLLCSDGLYNMVAENEMQEIISQNSIDQATEMLIELANQRGGTDNITLILVKTDSDFPVDAEIAEKAKIEADKFKALHRPALDELNPEAVNAVDENGENFDPYALPELEENLKKMRQAKPKPPEEKEAKPAEAAAEEAKDPEKDKTAEENNEAPKTEASAEGAAAEKIPNTEKMESGVLKIDELPEELIQPRRSTQSIIITGVMAGIIGGTVVVLLSKIFFMSPPKNNPPEVQPDTRDESVFNVPVPKMPNIKNDSVIVSMNQDPVKSDGSPNVAANNTNTDSGDAMANLEKRKEKLEMSIEDTKINLERFANPVNTNIEESIAAEDKKFNSLSDNLKQVRNEIDTATRKLSIWYGRKTRIKESDSTNLASEVAVSSEEVRKKKEEFELASWNYLKESETLRYMPADTEQRKKVDQLIEVRNNKIKEMSEAVVQAIEKEIKVVEKGITEFTLQREKLQDQLDYAEKNLQNLKILSSGTQEEKDKKKVELENMLVSLKSELGELQNLLPVKSSADAEKPAPQVKEEAPPAK